MAVHVEESALNDLRKALETAGESYKQNLSRLQNLINEITSGDIKGDPADDLLAKFQAKENTFKAIQQTIDEAEGYIGTQKTKFTSLISDLSSSMK
mgnify:FL=1